MSEPVLATRGLKRSFTQGDVTIEVLRGVDLAVQPGEIVALRDGRRTRRYDSVARGSNGSESTVGDAGSPLINRANRSSVDPKRAR